MQDGQGPLQWQQLQDTQRHCIWAGCFQLCIETALQLNYGVGHVPFLLMKANKMKKTKNFQKSHPITSERKVASPNTLDLTGQIL